MSIKNFKNFNKIKNFGKGSDTKNLSLDLVDVQRGVKPQKEATNKGLSSFDQSCKALVKRTIADNTVITEKTKLKNQNLLDLIEANIIAFDREDKPILFVSVDFRKGRKLDDINLAKLMINYQADISYIMLVKPETTAIFKWGQIKPIFLKNTIDLLSFYEPDFGKKRTFQSYLTTLVEAWLRDLAYHWKSEDPPFREEIEKIGLLEKLNNGSTKEIN